MASNSWFNGWLPGDIPTAAEFKKGVGAIADTTLGGSAASIDLTGLPTSYAHLLVAIVGRGDTAASNVNVSLRFNNDSAANYSMQHIQGNTTTPTAAESVGQTSILCGFMAAASATAGHPGSLFISLPGYSGTTFFKQALCQVGLSLALTTTNSFVSQRMGVWASTAAINRLTLLPVSGNFIAGTRMTVYAMGS